MSGKLSLTIKDYHNGGGDLTFEVSVAATSVKTVSGGDLITLKVLRKPDKHSTRLGMFAYLRKNRPGYQNLGFSGMTLIFDRFSGSGKFLSRTITVFSDIGVESVLMRGDEEEIIFIAGYKSADLAISAVVGGP
jgi:hypothetical protein